MNALTPLPSPGRRGEIPPAVSHLSHFSEATETENTLRQTQTSRFRKRFTPRPEGEGPGVRALWPLLIPLLLLTFWLGARGLDARSIWADEVYSIRDAGGPFFGPLSPPEIWARVASGNPWHTPGFFIMLNGWSHYVGWSAPALRAFSLFLGMIAVAWTYRLGRDALSPRAGLFAAVILGTAAFYTHYLYEIRMYTLIVLLTVFTIWIYRRVMLSRRAPTRRAWVALLLGMTGVLYTHYLAALVLVALGLYHLLFAPKNHRWWLVTGMALLAGMLFVLPWGHVLIDGLSRNAKDVGLQNRVLGDADVLVELLYLFGNGSLPLVVVFGALALIPVWRQRSRGAAQLWFIALVMIGLVLVANALLHIIAASRVRYLLSLWPLLALLVGLGLTQLERLRRYGRPLALIALALWVVLGIYRGNDTSFTSDIRSSWFVFPMQKVVRDLTPNLQQGDVVINYLPDDSDLWVYFNSFDIANYYFNGTVANYHVSMTLPDKGGLKANDWTLMTGLLDDHERVWAAYMPPTEPKVLSSFRQTMADDHFVVCKAPVEQPDLRVELFARSPVCCLPDAAATPLIRYPDEVALTGMEPLPDSVDQTLPVLLGWSVGDAINYPKYSVALHVINADGKLVAQADNGLPVAAFQCQPVTVDVSKVPPGEYRLEAIVYSWETGARLTGTLTATGAQGDSLPLGTVRVAR